MIGSSGFNSPDQRLPNRTSSCPAVDFRFLG
jgi:hypothetical protein